MACFPSNQANVTMVVYGDCNCGVNSYWIVILATADLQSIVRYDNAMELCLDKLTCCIMILAITDLQAVLHYDIDTS
jgi:hypothetical protein